MAKLIEMRLVISPKAELNRAQNNEQNKKKKKTFHQSRVTIIIMTNDCIIIKTIFEWAILVIVATHKRIALTNSSIFLVSLHFHQIDFSLSKTTKPLHTLSNDSSHFYVRLCFDHFFFFCDLIIAKS